MIRCSSIGKRFGAATALQGLSVEIPRGEIAGFVGPDGSGKSTLLRIIAGIMPPDEGTAEFNQKNIYHDTNAIKEKLAYMPQRFGLYEDLTVEENIHFFGRLFGLRRAEINANIHRLYEFSRLGPFKTRLAGTLSGGMKQKLGLSCCLIHRPELLILDEPTNGVDPVSRREFWDILYDLLLERVTIIISTAYLDEAERCSHLSLMHRGAIIRTGTPSSIKDSIGKTLLEIKMREAPRAEKVLQDHFRDSFIRRSGDTLKILVSDTRRDMNTVKKLLAVLRDRSMKLTLHPPGLEDCFLDIITSEAGR